MTDVLARKLIVVTGKGGTGKSTIAGALALWAASRGVRTVVAEVGEQHRLATHFQHRERRHGAEMRLEQNLHSISIDPDAALLEWLQVLGGRISGRLLATSGTFQYFAAAAPGAKELVSMVKVWELTQSRRRRARGETYDLVVLDAPATGHALGLLQSPATFGAIARVGPVATQTARVRALLEDPRRTCYVGVAQPAELAVTETVELAQGLRRVVGRELDVVVANGVLPARFSEAELRQIADAAETAESDAASLYAASARAARAAHERARRQRNQLRRLRRRGVAVVTVPFRFQAQLDLESLREIGERLGGAFERLE